MIAGHWDAMPLVGGWPAICWPTKLTARQMPVSARLRRAVTVGGETVLPAGAVVTGEVSEVDSLGTLRVVRAHVPIAEMFAYSSSLRGATQGRGSYAMELFEYRDVPNNIAEQIIKSGT